MIDPNTLMRNNIVLFRGIESEVEEITGDEIRLNISGDLHYFSYMQIYPIPLTPEILERCGFVKTRNIPELYSAPDGLFNVINDYGSAWYNINKKVLEVGYYNFNGKQNEIPCESLHHLQNLLTVLGQKLEVK